MKINAKLQLRGINALPRSGALEKLVSAQFMISLLFLAQRCIELRRLVHFTMSRDLVGFLFFFWAEQIVDESHLQNLH